MARAGGGLTYARRVDGNHAEIVKALRKVGGRVLDLSRVGGGCPDLLVAFRGRNVLLEVKQPGESPNKAQVEFIAMWGGELHVVRSPQEAVNAVVGV